MTALALVTVALVTAGIVVAFARDSPEEPAGRDDASVATEVSSPTVDAARPGGSDDSATGLISSLRGEMSAYEQSVVADGAVTRDEWLAAREAAATCLEERSPGARVFREGDAAYDPNALVGYSIPADVVDHYPECSAEFLDHVDLIYAAQNGPSEAETEQREAFLAECFKRAGVAPGASLDDAASRAAVVACGDEMEAAFGPAKR